MSLFREEVATRKVDNLHGNINLALPLSWQVLTSALAIMLITCLLFLASAKYSRTETALGFVLPTGGILKVIPPRPGQVEQVEVHEGDPVRKGQRLGVIRAEQRNVAGNGTQTEVLAAIARQREGLAQQRLMTEAAALSEHNAYSAQTAGFRSEVRNIEAQIAVQQKLVDMAQSDLLQAKEIAAGGFISRRDLDTRQETLLSRQQQLAVLEQSKASKTSGIEQNLRTQRQASARASGMNAELSASLAQVERERATAGGELGYSLLSPVDGQVAALDLQVGDAVNGQEPAMMILPSRGRLVAKLYIPVRAAGFVRAGQTVRLALDAYAYERFGTVTGQITSVSSAPIMKSERGGDATPFYIAMVGMPQPWIKAYGRHQRLLSGMTLTAQIVVERRSLLQWLFDPLVAARARA